jgi:glucose/arabinose dehydrogenase
MGQLDLFGGRPMAARPVVSALEPRRLLASFLPGFFETPVTGDVAFGSTLAVAPDGKLFVVEQPGQIQVWSGFAPGDTLLQQNFFRDAQPAVNFAGERGMFGIAFDPDYADNRFVYVHYTKDQFQWPNRITRFTANAAGDLALAGSETLILEMEPSTASNHNGGGMHFGGDGKLYVGLGDNGTGANAQSITTLKGKILRMNVAPGDLIPSDNPASIEGIPGTTAGINRLIWAAGLRNPFTFAIQPGTGRMFINDVGEVSWEEINDGAPGRNYGWPATEGDFDPTLFPDFTRPIHAYDHSTGGRAIVGGAFYNPSVHTFPPDYAGDSFFGDFMAGFIRRIDPVTHQVSHFAETQRNIADLRIAPDGSLLYLTHHQTSGRVFRVQFDDVAPTVVQSQFVFDGFSLPDPPHRLRFTFSEDVSASLSNADLVLTNTTTSQVVPTASLALEWNPATLTATFTFPGLPGQILPDGQYAARIPAGGVTDPAGNALPQDVTVNFFFLQADVNHDAVVNLLDFNILAGNFGQSPRTFSQGDLDYDNVVNLADFNVLAGRFGAVLGPQVGDRTPDSDQLAELE